MNFARALEKRITQAGSATAFAAELGVTPAYIWMVRSGNKRPSKRLLRALGYERRVTYRRIASGV